MKRIAILIPLISILLYSCASTGYNTQKGAAAGAILGAIAGQAIGKNTAATLHGAAAGAILGAVVGNAVDQYEIERRMEARSNLTVKEDCPPGKWVEVPGRWVGRKWVPSHKVWVPVDP